jgi:hypothetical protein
MGLPRIQKTVTFVGWGWDCVQTGPLGSEGFAARPFTFMG